MKNRSLQSLITIRLGAVFTFCVIIFTAIVGFLVHHQVHEQTDAMILQIARTEAHGVISEFDAGVHVHDTALRLPSLNSPVAEKYSIAYRPDGEILASTSNLTRTELSKSWFTGLSTIGSTQFFDDNGGPKKLRVGALVAQDPHGGILIFASAVPHESIDLAVWRTIFIVALLSSFMLIVVIFTSILVARTITEDLQELCNSCLEFLNVPEELDSWLERFEMSPKATIETSTLAGTIRDLITRLQRTLDVQNRFVAEVAHELRTPLTSLNGELEIALRKDRTAAQYREFIENASVDAARLVNLAEKLLEAARLRIDDIHVETLLLSDLIHETVASNASLLSEQKINVSIETDTSLVYADRVATGRVLNNLIANVIQHSGAKSLKISCRDGSIHIKDDGKGLSLHVRNNLFIPFAQREGPGHGLGLYISKRLMEKQKGQLSLTPSSRGLNWTCTFTLKRKSDA